MNSRRNVILRALSEEQYPALFKGLVPVGLALQQSLSEPGEPIDQIYFLESGLVSTDALTEAGESVEVGVVGREGMAGVVALLGQPQLFHSVIMQGEGHGFRVRASVVREEFLRGGPLQHMIYSFLYLQIMQTTQSVLCNRMHEVEQRLARWLLTSADRQETETLQLTQEFLAQMLGARRSTVTVAAGNLQRVGLIDYSRGKIKITDRPLLEKAACECYGLVRSGYERVIPKNAVGERAYVPQRTVVQSMGGVRHSGSGGQHLPEIV